MPQFPKHVLPPSWPQVLEGMQRSLAQALAAVPEPAPEPAASGERVPPWQATLQRLDSRFGHLETCCRRAVDSAGAMDAELAAGADGLRAWLAAASANGQTLADCSGRTV
jgi:hypothetical protein